MSIGIQEIAADCGCDAVVHSYRRQVIHQSGGPLSGHVQCHQVATSADQWNPKYGCKGTVTTRFALIALVAWQYSFDSAPKERRRRRAERRLSKRMFLESPFLLCPLKVCS